MNTSTRFAVATHILTLLAMAKGPISSSMLAASVNTSAAVVRQLLMRLSEESLVTSKMGPGGGSLLGRAAAEISLQDVWQATENDEVFCTHRKAPSQDCSVGRHILDGLAEVSCQAREAFLEPLRTRSIADMVAFVRRREEACRRGCAEGGGSPQL